MRGLAEEAAITAQRRASAPGTHRGPSGGVCRTHTPRFGCRSQQAPGPPSAESQTLPATQGAGSGQHPGGRFSDIPRASHGAVLMVEVATSLRVLHFCLLLRSVLLGGPAWEHPGA